MKKNILLIAFVVFSIQFFYSQNSNALNFDGIDDYVSLNPPSILNDISSNDFTIETWIYPETFVFSRVLFAQVGTSDFVSISITGDGDLIFYVGDIESRRTFNPILLNEWSHIACTWNHSTEDIQIYVNGVLRGTLLGGSSTTGTNDLMTLGSSTSQSQFFDGTIDELRIWDDVRTESEIVSSMNQELLSLSGGLVGYYKFNQGTAGGNNVTESSLIDELNINNGVLNNFTLNGNSSNWIGDNPLSVNDILNTHMELMIYPNPAQDLLYVDGVIPYKNYSIYNINGLTVSEGILDIDQRINISELPDGMYFLKFNDYGTYKILKK